MKKKIRRWGIVLLILIIGVPFGIHCLFKLNCGCDFLIAEWSAGDILSYYGTVILGGITVYLSYIALEQNQAANDINNRLLKIDEMERKAVLKLNLSESEITDEGNIKFVSICFENMTNNVIVDLNIEKSEKLLLKSNWVFNQENENGIIVTKFESISGQGLIEEEKKLRYTFTIKNYDCKFLLLSFKTVSKSIYGLETTQNYNIILTDSIFNGYKTLVEE